MLTCYQCLRKFTAKDYGPHVKACRRTVPGKDPAVPWVLTEHDKKFLSTFRITPE